MDQKITNQIMMRLKEVSWFDRVKRLIDVIPSNGYLRSNFINKYDHLTYEEAKYHNIKDNLFWGWGNDRSHHFEDIMYLEVPSDYTFPQYEELSRLLYRVPTGWVLYSSAAPQVEKYFSWCRSEDGLFSNDSYIPPKDKPLKYPDGPCIKIDEYRYKYCDRASYFYGQGNEVKKKVSARTTKLGEMAFASLFGLKFSVNSSEFSIKDNKINIVTSKDIEYDYIRVKEENLCTFDSNYYIGSYVGWDSVRTKRADVIFTGYCTKEDLLSFGESRYDIETGSYVRECSFKKLRPFEEFVNVLRSGSTLQS